MRTLLTLLKTFIKSSRGKERLLELIKRYMYGTLSTRFRDRVKSYRLGESDLTVPAVSGDYSLYLHFPFCRSFCKYCKFSKCADREMIERYCRALKGELKLWSELYPFGGSRLKGAYFGGGTPSIMPLEHLEELVALLGERMGFDRESRITIESTPDSLSREFVRKCSELGIGRISIGGQSFDNRVLKEMGRSHDGAAIEWAVNLVQEGGLSHNVDLLYGWESQSLESFLADIKRAVTLEVEHLSLYPLAIPPKKGGYSREPALLERQRELYYAGRAQLLEAGYRQYSFEHFTRGKSCAYTEMMAGYPAPDLLPIGPGSYGWLGEFGLIRPGNVKEYIEHLEGGNLPLYYYRSSLKERTAYHTFLALHLLAFDSEQCLAQSAPAERRMALTVLEYLKYFELITVEEGVVRVKEECYYKLSELMGDLVFYVVL